MKSKKQLHIIAYGAQGTGVSGGDRIFIELARRLSDGVQVNLWVSQEGKEMCQRMGLSSNVAFHVSNINKFRRFGAIVYNLALVIVSIKTGFFASLPNVEKKSLYAYSASEFWMDSLPTLFWKLRKPNLIWIASWYQTAPSPLTGFSLTNSPRHRLASVPYWFFQKTTKPYISAYANGVCVNNIEEKKQFPVYSRNNATFVMYGAVDTLAAQKFEKLNKKTTKKFEAVFQGRFHPQKGVLELVDIWKQVVEDRPKAKLVMIGDGPLMKDVISKIKKLKLSKNILLKGYVFDGVEKNTIFLESRVVVHPAYYDSGGMASAEAMVFGLPVVGFNLPSYKDYYPKGMVKVPQENINAFSEAILKLLKDGVYYNKMAKEAKEMIYQSWSWDKRVDDFWNFCLNI